MRERKKEGGGEGERKRVCERERERERDDKMQEKTSRTGVCKICRVYECT